MSKNVIVPAKPTKLLVEKNSSDVLTKGRVEDVTLLYVNLQDGELAFNSETERNYTVQTAVTQDTAQNWKTVFPKNGCRVVDNEQFVKSYKIDPPYPEQSEQYILKLKSHTTYQNDLPEHDIVAGDLVPYEAPSRPKLYEIVEGKPVDVTLKVQPANGSKGTVAFRVTTNKFGTFPLLSGVLVTDLVELERNATIASDYGITDETQSTRRVVIPNNHEEDNGPYLEEAPRLDGPEEPDFY
jgi:hypothetical protein